MWGWSPHSQEWENWSLPKLPKTQSSSSGVKTPGIGVFFIPLERPHMSHLDICSPSYGQKKGRESNWQFDSRPLKVKNQHLPNVCNGSATWHWKDLDESYNFGLNLVPIRAWGEKLWMPKVPGVQTGTVSGLHLGSPEKKSHLDVASARSCREYYKGEGGGFPRIRAVVSQVSPSCPWLVLTPKKGAEWVLTNLWLVFGCMTVKQDNCPYS